MNCRGCEDIGIIPFVLEDNPKLDDAIGAEDLLYALCLCPRGQALRARRNGAGKRSAFAVWQLWAAREGINPSRVYLVEDVFVASALEKAGLQQTSGAQQPMGDRIAEAMRTSRARL